MGITLFICDSAPYPPSPHSLLPSPFWYLYHKHFGVSLKAISNTLEAAGRYLTTACNTLLFSRIFWILHAVATERNLIPFRAKQKGDK
jgi:hypothetical protein